GGQKAGERSEENEAERAGIPPTRRPPAPKAHPLAGA
ncbi:unnamed protein product, partial [marine sediment metagenome]